MADIVYVLTNEAMPGLVKIGLTADTVEARLTQLSSHTGVPLAFECYFAAEVQYDLLRVEPKELPPRVDPIFGEQLMQGSLDPRSVLDLGREVALKRQGDARM